MISNARVGTAKFLIIPEPFVSRIAPSDRSKLLGREIKSKLFDIEILFSEQSRRKAQELLDFIYRLSDSTLKDTFELKSDDIYKIPFRLLKPRGPHEERSDKSRKDDELTNSYIAASYCWRQPQDSPYRPNNSDNHRGGIETQSHLLPMSLLLYNALLNERESEFEGIWIDQVCVNQDDEAEKQETVNSMDIIYKRARAVVILLDDIEITSVEQQALRAHILDFEVKGENNESFRSFYNDSQPYLINNSVMGSIYLKILQARWFSRAWCMHEARLGKQHIFLIRCEQQHGSVSMVFRFTNLFMLNLLDLGGQAWREELQQNRIWLVPLLTRAVEDSKDVKRSSSSFMQVFAETFSQSAGGNPKIESLEMRKFDANLDKLSIVTNTIDVGLAVNLRARDIGNSIHPPTEDECCRRFTILAIASWDPSALCTSGNELRTSSSQRSWMCWPLITDTNAYIQHRIGRWNMGFDTSAASSYIALQMGFYNRAGGLRWATEPRVKLCEKFFHICSSKGTQTIAIGGKKLALKNVVWRDLIVKTLAVIMECGIEWLAINKDDPMERFKTPVTQSALEKLLNCEAATFQDKFVEATYTSTVHDDQEAQALINLVFYLIYRGPAVEEQLGQSMEFWQPVCMANETGSKVLTFVRRFPGREVFCATPLTLFPDFANFYSGLFRAWTLIKGDPEREQQSNGEWIWKYHLMGKSRIFGRVMSADEKHAFASIFNNVRIYGPIDLTL